MSERTTSREEADVLKSGINGLVNDFERMGFDRRQIGAALAGIGLGITQIHCSHDTAISMLDRVRDCLMADVAPKN